MVIVPMRKGVHPNWETDVLRCAIHDKKLAFDAVQSHNACKGTQGGLVYGWIRVQGNKVDTPQNAEKWLVHPEWKYGNSIVGAKPVVPIPWPFPCPRSKRSPSDDEWSWMLKNIF